MWELIIIAGISWNGASVVLSSEMQNKEICFESLEKAKYNKNDNSAILFCREKKKDK